MGRTIYALLVTAALAAPATAGPILFNFDNARRTPRCR